MSAHPPGPETKSPKDTAAPAFFELGLRSNFSFLEGASHPEELVTAASRLGIGGIGLADRNTVAGVVRLHAVAKKERYGFRPGARLSFADETPDLLAYPMNRAGWGRLCRLLSAGNIRSTKGTCTLFEQDLLDWNADLLFAAFAPSAETADIDTFRIRLERLTPHLGQRLHIAIGPRYDGTDRLFFAELARLSDRLGLPLLATNDAVYHRADRRPLADVLTSIREHVPIAEAGFRLTANAERHLKAPKEMARLLREHPEAIAATERFWHRLDFSLDEIGHQYPDEAIDGEPAAVALRRLAYEGARSRFPNGVPEKVAKLVEDELTLIAEKRYEPFFLTVYRIIRAARAKDILCQGRGSAANSAVCYCLGITEVNPQQTTLLFARFISTERDEPPDIDVDFEHARRQEVIDFIYETYSKEHAALAAAVISYRARSAGRETAKAFGLSEDVQSALSGSIWGWWTEGFSEDQAKAAGLDMREPTTKRVLGYADLLQRFPRHLSQHVGGFVITRDRLDEIVPIMNTADGRYMIEWDKDDLDTLKILKVDVLALGMLTCLAKGLRLLDRHYGRRETLASIFNDHQDAVYEMATRADTIGVFQIESRAQMSMLPRLKPKRFYDLVIEVAIVRPGPIQGNMVHPYLKRREGREKADYPSKELEAVLERTLGVPLFQEQAMQIAITAAGFSPGEADRLRRAMATFRRTGEVGNFKQRMIDGMVARGYPADFAERCFSQIEGFGEYGFPESHAASFALLVYVSCWFKAFYPDVFCAALLNSQPMGFYPPAQLVRDAREHGVTVRPLDINASDWDTRLEPLGPGDGISPHAVLPRHRPMIGVMRTRHALRLGFSLAKGLSEKDMRHLVALRGRGYDSVRDLWRRTGLSRGTIEKLAEADAFHSLGLDRRAALWAVRALGAPCEDLPLFSVTESSDIQQEAAVSLPSLLPGEEVIADYRSLSLSLKAHPLSFLRADLDRLGCRQNKSLDATRSGTRLTVAGLVLVRQRPGSARGVIFMTLEDETGVANIIVWPKVFETFRPVVMGARLVRVRGRLQNHSNVVHVVAEEIVDMTAALGLLKGEERRFALNPRGDEAQRPTVDQRRKPSRAEIIEAAQAMPGGRNFH